MTLISITIPTCNRAEYLAELLDSIHANNCCDLEVVIADNASKDETQEVVSRYAAMNKSPRYVYFKHAAMLSFDLNVDSAVKAASGEYIWLMGDDDRLRPNAVGRIGAILERHSYATGLVNYSDWDEGLLECRNSRVFNVVDDQLNVNIEGLLRPSNFWFSFMSIHVVRREIWLGVDRSMYYSDSPSRGDIHMHIPLMAALKGPNFLVAEVLLEKRASRIDLGTLDSNDVVGSWYRSIAGAGALGVSSTVCDLFFRTYINDFHCTRDMMAKKIRRSPIYAKDFAFVHEHYRRFPHYWIKVWPLRWIPRSVLMSARASFKWVRGLWRRLR